MNLPSLKTRTLPTGLLALCLTLLLVGCASTPTKVPVQVDCPKVPKQYTDPLKIPPPARLKPANYTDGPKDSWKSPPAATRTANLFDSGTAITIYEDCGHLVMVTVDHGGASFSVIRDLLTDNELRIVNKLRGEGRAAVVDVRAETCQGI